ncbi:MAG: TadE/TadG family type IV pilus assembly protein [Burkholderiales bacterium]
MTPSRKNKPRSGVRSAPRGQALVEFLIIYPTLLLLVLGAFQFALVYQAKLTLNYATFMAARQGALKNGKSTSIKDGLAASMTPLFATNKDDYVDLIKARAIAAVEVFNPLNTQIVVLSPTANAYNAHKADSQSGTEIPNDNLMYRPTTAKGGMSVQDANILTIEVTYCTRLIVPIINKVIYSLYFGFVGEKVLAGEYFSEAAVPTNLAGKRCADVNDQVQSLVNLVASFVPGGSSFLSGFSFPAIPTTIPGLNWNVGGYRIPITSRATVRMQSPMTQAP